MNPTFNSQTPRSTVLIWSALAVAALTIGIFGFLKPFGTIGLLFPALSTFRLYRTKYTFEEDHLLIRSIFEKVEIPYSTIRDAQAEKANGFLRLNGFPAKIVSLKYNKFDDRFLLNASPEMLEALQYHVSHFEETQREMA